MEQGCLGQHRFFVAETGVVEEERKVIIILCCLNCGTPLVHEISVVGKATLSNKNKKEN